MARTIAVTLECFVKKGDKYLMLHRSPSKRILPNVWMAPGGHREFNEGLFACARREVREETGLEITNIRIRAHGNAFLKELNEEFYFHLLLADYAGGTLKPKIEDGEFVWLTEQEICTLPTLLAELKHVVPHICSNNNKVISYKAVIEKGNEMSYFEIEKDE
ncbi:hypothetical protein COY90_04395 [Candidatus Roizmanbacteria bacterium CG_4_10_14_0_8_um_filter_39_9]|uniref:Nudix hydrolase domain-containing protein n=1 Tax=Candidatus Roizmanbacteria bacterium CG_4_10_14_0_8_um_filter_39_9 TaxID=1974829 RepID=A0A2M7QBW9_9BACT|nr:MAG: hypothetical protein COY90_04395 [Candidatus Roizmanbacteria bacterium CG_4_10_14_0_8_um_filter_39_9]